MVDISDITLIQSVINVSQFLNALKNKVKKKKAISREKQIKLKLLVSNKER